MLRLPGGKDCLRDPVKSPPGGVAVKKAGPAGSTGFVVDSEGPKCLLPEPPAWLAELLELGPAPLRSLFPPLWFLHSVRGWVRRSICDRTQEGF